MLYEAWARNRLPCLFRSGRQRPGNALPIEMEKVANHAIRLNGMIVKPNQEITPRVLRSTLRVIVQEPHHKDATNGRAGRVTVALPARFPAQLRHTHLGHQSPHFGN